VSQERLARLTSRTDRTSVLTLLDKSAEQHQAARQALEDEIAGLKDTVDESAEESRKANEIAM
jgi:hypothetical protein